MKNYDIYTALLLVVGIVQSPSLQAFYPGLDRDQNIRLQTINEQLKQGLTPQQSTFIFADKDIGQQIRRMRQLLSETSDDYKKVLLQKAIDRKTLIKRALESI